MNEYACRMHVRPSDNFHKGGPKCTFLTRRIRNFLYCCQGRQIVVRHYLKQDEVFLYELGQHQWTRTPNPTKPNGLDTSRFDCGLTWISERNQPHVRPLGHWRDGSRPGRWVIYVPESFDPYVKLKYLKAKYHTYIP